MNAHAVTHKPPCWAAVSDKEPASLRAFSLSPAPLHTLRLRWSLWNNSLQHHNSPFINAPAHFRRVHRKDCPEHSFLQNDFPLLKCSNSLSSSTLCFGVSQTPVMRWTHKSVTSRCTRPSTNPPKEVMIWWMIPACAQDHQGHKSTVWITAVSQSCRHQGGLLLPALPSAPGFHFSLWSLPSTQNLCTWPQVF